MRWLYSGVTTTVPGQRHCITTGKPLSIILSRGVRGTEDWSGKVAWTVRCHSDTRMTKGSRQAACFGCARPVDDGVGICYLVVTTMIWVKRFIEYRSAPRFLCRREQVHTLHSLCWHERSWERSVFSWRNISMASCRFEVFISAFGLEAAARSFFEGNR